MTYLKKYKLINRIISVVMAVVIALSIVPGLVTQVSAEDVAFEESIAGFPESYKVLLRQLHEVHPNWRFVPFEVFIDLVLTVSQVVLIVVRQTFIDRLRIKFPCKPDVEISGVRTDTDFQIRRHGIHVIL